MEINVKEDEEYCHFVAYGIALMNVRIVIISGWILAKCPLCDRTYDWSNWWIWDCNWSCGS